MHVDNELVEFMPMGEQEYEEIIEEYEEKILVQEGALEPSIADFVNTSPAQGKPRCITLILNDHWIYICDVYLCYRIYIETVYVDIPTQESY